jgi:hypothetical protein
VCREWREDFRIFARYVGQRPSPEHSIDRIDNDGNYEPGNVRWATDFEQAANKRNNRRVEYRGRTLTISQLARECGRDVEMLRKRIVDYEWPVERAIATPSRMHNKPTDTMISFQGHTMTAAEWSKRTGIKAEILRKRIKRGWSAEKTLTCPRMLNRHTFAPTPPSPATPCA